jgi:hypothetical protein
MVLTDGCRRRKQAVGGFRAAGGFKGVYHGLGSAYVTSSLLSPFPFSGPLPIPSFSCMVMMMAIVVRLVVPLQQRCSSPHVSSLA